MFNYGTLQSMVEALLEHNKKILDFERGMEKLLGPDSTVMSTWMSDAPYEMLKSLIMAEGGETEDGWNWFQEHLGDFMKGTGSKIAIKEDSDKGGWKEYEVKTLHDYYLYLKGELPVANTYTDEGMSKVSKQDFHTLSFGPNGMEIFDA